MSDVLSFIKTVLEDSTNEYEKEMEDEKDKNMYIDLCRTIGPLTDLVQSTGGNISVKNTKCDTLHIKKSGTRIVSCDFQTYSLKMIESIVMKNEKLPHGASIETYFHTFPSKFIVHLHPGPALDFLTTVETSSVAEYKVIEYEKPGYDLYLKLLPYKNEKILILKNHGILICENSLDAIYERLNEVVQLIYTYGSKHSDLLFVSTFRKMLQTKYSVDLLVKPFFLGLNGFIFHDRIFFQYTPDHSVFLTKAPFMIEPKPSSLSVDILSNLFEKHLNTYGKTTFPTIICVDGMMYTCSKTFDGCIGLEEMLYSYFCISNHSLSKPLCESEVEKLTNWSSEIERKQKLGLIAHS